MNVNYADCEFTRKLSSLKLSSVSKTQRRDHACPYCKGVAFGTASALKTHISALHLKIQRRGGRTERKSDLL